MTNRCPVTGYFFPSPTAEEARARVKEVVDKIVMARKQARRSKLEPCIPTISTYLRETTASLGVISRELRRQHQVSADISTLSRFIQSHPLLAELRPAKSANIEMQDAPKV